MMKVHSTNYYNTLIEIAEDCPVQQSEAPPVKGQKQSVANLQFDMIKENPYQFTSDEVLFSVYANRKDLDIDHWNEHRKSYFSNGQPCYRASPLPKRYGFGIHNDKEGKIALLGVETEAYQRLLEDKTVKKIKAMRSKRT